MKLSHIGVNKMVNIGNKVDSLRYAKAKCSVLSTKVLLDMIKSNSLEKGDVLRTAEIAGIMAAKQTSLLIPLCHQINLNTCRVQIELKEESFEIETYVESFSKTGVEMEAIVACQISASTIYDMCKAVDKKMTITNLRLVEKFGGKSGHFINNI